MYSEVEVNGYRMRICDDGKIYIDSGSGRVFLTSIDKIYEQLSKDE